MNLLNLTSADLKVMLKLVKQREAYERQLLSIYEEAKKRKPSEKQGKVARKQPSLRELITDILRKAKKPMSVPQIYEASLMMGYHWRSGEPINALNVKMYTDKTFKKVAPGVFVLRKG